MSNITSDSMKCFKIIYCEYKLRRKKGFSKADSIVFEAGQIQTLKSFSDWLRPDIDSALSELVNNKFVSEDVTGRHKLTDGGILYMESKPKEFFNDLKTLFDIASIFI